MEFTDFRATSSPDMIFIDAIHEYDALKADVAHALKLMKSGLLCGHDYNDSWPGVIEAVNELFPKFDVCGTIWSVQI